jgi:hypothetical protein
VISKHPLLGGVCPQLPAKLRLITPYSRPPGFVQGLLLLLCKTWPSLSNSLGSVRSCCFVLSHQKQSKLLGSSSVTRHPPRRKLLLSALSFHCARERFEFRACQLFLAPFHSASNFDHGGRIGSAARNSHLGLRPFLHPVSLPLPTDCPIPCGHARSLTEARRLLHQLPSQRQASSTSTHSSFELHASFRRIASAGLSARPNKHWRSLKKPTA